MKMRRLAATAAAIALASACGSARRGQPFEPPLVLDEQQARGQRVFMLQCNQCHPEGEGGLGPALNNKPLPGPAIRLQVRQGIGEMPAFGEDVISDADLDALSAYLLELQTPSR